MKPLTIVHTNMAVVGYTVIGLLAGHVLQIHLIGCRNRLLNRNWTAQS